MPVAIKNVKVISKACFILSLAAGISICCGRSADAEQIPGWKIINFNIDKSVAAQKKVGALIDYTAELHSSENAIRLWTNSRGLKVLRNSIAELRKKYPNYKWLSFEGSGDFHQTAALLIESLPESAKPLTVVMFDNHPDWFKAPAHFHCGAWVVQALHHSWVERVIMIGQNSSDIRGDQFRFAPFHELCRGRVELHPFERNSSLVPLIWTKKVAGVNSSSRNLLGTKLKFQTMQSHGAGKMSENLARELSGKNVYISIDKDVLQESEAISDWDQGKMSLSDLVVFIERLADSSNLIGMDVCGERSPEPVHGLMKSIDCGREFKRKIKNFEQANTINERANLRLINALGESFSASKHLSGQIEKKSN